MDVAEGFGKIFNAVDIYTAKCAHGRLYDFRRKWVCRAGTGNDVRYAEPVGKTYNRSEVSGVLNGIEGNGEPAIRVEFLLFEKVENSKYILRILLLRYPVDFFLLDSRCVCFRMFGYPCRGRENFAELKQGHTLQYATGTLRKEGTQLVSALGCGQGLDFFSFTVA